MVNAKILLHKLWSLRLNWDEKIPVEMKNLWSNIAEDLMGLHNIAFSRHVVDSDSRLKLYLLCDALPQAYGFVVYGVQNEKITHNIFKSKSEFYETKNISVDGATCSTFCYQITSNSVKILF